MMPISVDDFVLVLVDLQQRVMPAIHESERVLRQAVRLANLARLLEVPVLGTEQSPARLGNNLDEISSLCATTVSKTHFDACADGLLDALPPRRDKVLLAGCETHVCVMQTALGLLGNGREVWLATDAIGSRTPADRDVALARLGAAGARLVTVEMIAFEWLRHADHPSFRDALVFIK
jgi:nicotinamidase-related amidase